MNDSRVLVIGIGNDFRSDDGAGIAAAQQLRNKLTDGNHPELFADLRILEHKGEGAALLDLWQDADTVIVLDAVQSGRPPGTILYLHAGQEPLPRQYFRHSTHEFGLPEAVEMARVLGCLPRRLLVIGIEAGCMEPGTALSSPVAAAVEKIADELSNQTLGS
jgi:hydrogenase maturation protease